MMNSQSELNDWLRPEYKRSDFGEIIRGKHATTQVNFHQLVQALLSCIGEEEGLRFVHHSVGNYLAQHKPGEWTFEIDNRNQITLRYWLSELVSIEELISNPTCVTTPRDRTELQDALHQGVLGLRTKVTELKNRQ
ncbi:MAG TPA: hypothetical protein VEW46_06785 [Pyrinomonadaceae bacterium]|nr:hypothetical protein [Pyrinomonadaceae bacterium]